MVEDIRFILWIYKDIVWGPGPIIRLNLYQVTLIKLVGLWMFMFLLTAKGIT